MKTITILLVSMTALAACEADPDSPMGRLKAACDVGDNTACADILKIDAQRAETYRVQPYQAPPIQPVQPRVCTTWNTTVSCF